MSADEEPEVDQIIWSDRMQRFEILLADGRVLIAHEQPVSNGGRPWWQNEAGEPMVSPQEIRATESWQPDPADMYDEQDERGWWGEDSDEESVDEPLNEDGHLEAAYEARYEYHD